MQESSKFEVREVRLSEFYRVLKLWWSIHEFPLISPSFLPETIWVSYSGNTPTHSVFCYKTNSNVCWLSFPTSNPALLSTARKGGLTNLFNKVEEVVGKEGYEYMFTTSGTTSIEGALGKVGYTKGDSDISHYTKKINI